MYNKYKTSERNMHLTDNESQKLWNTRAGLSSKNEQSFSNVVQEQFQRNEHKIKLEFLIA